MQPALFTTPTYTGQFATVHFVSPEWGYQLTCWEMGKPAGHKWFTGIVEALLECFNLGLRLATPQMQRVFNEDVILSGE